MLGNCARGSLRIEMRPARTVTMAMTIATIGRRMKKFEIIEKYSGVGNGGWGVGNGAWAPKLFQLSDDQREYKCSVLKFTTLHSPFPTPHSLTAYLNGNGLTTESGLTFCVPSATTLSPGFSPSSITHIVPMRSPALTGRTLTLLSSPTTATR